MPSGPDDTGDGYQVPYRDLIARVIPVTRPIHSRPDSMTRSSMLLTHLDRMAPMMETDRHHQDWIIRVTPVKRPTYTEINSMNRSSGLFIHPVRLTPATKIVRLLWVRDTPLHQFACVYHPESSAMSSVTSINGQMLTLLGM